MRESRQSGSVRGAVSNGRPYRDSFRVSDPSCRRHASGMEGQTPQDNWAALDPTFPASALQKK